MVNGIECLLKGYQYEASQISPTHLSPYIICKSNEARISRVRTPETLTDSCTADPFCWDIPENGRRLDILAPNFRDQQAYTVSALFGRYLVSVGGTRLLYHYCPSGQWDPWEMPKMDLLSPEIYEPNRTITYQQIPTEIYSLQLFLVLVWCDPSRYYTSDTSQAGETHNKAKAESVF